jgi:hypothetical protein
VPLGSFGVACRIRNARRLLPVRTRATMAVFPLLQRLIVRGKEARLSALGADGVDHRACANGLQGAHKGGLGTHGISLVQQLLKGIVGVIMAQKREEAQSAHKEELMSQRPAAGWFQPRDPFVAPVRRRSRRVGMPAGQQRLLLPPGRHDIPACREPRLLRVAAAEVRVEYLLLFDRCLGRGETRGEQTER